MQGVIPELMDEDGVNGANKDVGVRKLRSDRFVILTGVFHAGLCFTAKEFDLSNKVIDDGLGVGMSLSGMTTTLLGLRNVISAFGNIDTNSIQRRCFFGKY